MRNSRILSSLLVCISLLMLIIPAIPHHHHAHSDCLAGIELHITTQTHCCTHQEEAHPATGVTHHCAQTCQGGCLTHFDSTTLKQSHRLSVEERFATQWPNGPFPWASPVACLERELSLHAHSVALPPGLPPAVHGLRAPPTALPTV